jgi:CarboxypepD_reg-like domain
LKKYIAILLFVATGNTFLWSQIVQPDPSERKVIQITGIVAEADSSSGIPFVNIRLKSTSRGTVSDYYGFFTIVAREGDTLVFSSVGYAPAVAFLPKKMESDNYYMLAKMVKDTLQLKVVNIGPFNAKTFGDAFVNLKLKDDDYERAMKNLDQKELEAIKMGMPIDGSVAFKGAMQQRSYALYNAGGLPSPSIFNPFAWAQFFKALKQGKFKDPYKDIKK